MIVIDASAVLELLLQTPLSSDIARRVFNPAQTVHAPHLLDLEVLQVLRRLTGAGVITSAQAFSAIEDFQGLAITRYDHTDLLTRIWELRHALSAYDAAYVTLAEALGAPLLTCDGKLARSGAHAIRVELVAK